MIRLMNRQDYNRFVMAMCGLAGLLYGIDVGLIAAALPYIRETCGFSPTELSSIVAAVLLGAIPGSFVAAQVAERWGRLAAFRLTAIVFAVAVPLICFSHGSYALMMTGRLLQGVGCALVGLAAPLYMAECAPAENRGKGTGMIQLVLTVGLVVAALVGFAATAFFGAAESPETSVQAKNAAWQSIFWFSAIPTVFLFLGSFRLKESPRWLFKKGRVEAARASLACSADAAGVERTMREMAENAAAEQAKSAAGAVVKETLLQRKYVLPFLIAFLVMCLTQATGINSVLNYSVVLMQKAGLAGSLANVSDTVIKFTNFAMTIVALALVDRRGRKFLLSLGTAGVAVGLSAVGLTFLGLERGWLAAGPFAGWLATGGFVLFIAAYGVGPGVCVWLANSELMPIRIRANGMMIAGYGNAATSWIIAQNFLPWSAAWGESGVFFTLAGVAVLYFLVAAFVLPETKGKSLEEIERYFTKKN